MNVSKRKSLKKEKKVEITTTENEIAAFEKPKNCLVTTSDENPDSGILLLTDFEKPFILYTDACHEGIGAVLCQVDNNKRFRPNAYYSRKLTNREKKYAIGEKELMTIVFNMEHFKIYLFGREFTVRTDHGPLQWLKNMDNPSMRLARWLIIIRQFDFKIEFIDRHKNAVADA